VLSEFGSCWHALVTPLDMVGHSSCTVSGLGGHAVAPFGKEILVKRFATLFVVALLATALLALPANAGESCHNINASAEGVSLTGPTDNPVVTAGQTRGGGLLQGTTSGESLVTEFSGFPDLPFTGPQTFTTNRGTVTFTVTGVVSIGSEPDGSNAYWNDGTVTDSTGKLAGATGNIAVVGVQAPDGSFTQTMTGEICVDLNGNGKG
jgi:hypothetical protein